MERRTGAMLPSQANPDFTCFLMFVFNGKIHIERLGFLEGESVGATSGGTPGFTLRNYSQQCSGMS